MRTTAALIAFFIGLTSIAVAEEQVGAKWQSDYAEAYKEARRENRLLLIWFTNDALTDAESEFARLIDDEQLTPSLANVVLVRVGKSASVKIDDQSIWLLGHAAFGELLRLPGLAMIDLRDNRSPHYGNVVSVYPFRAGKPLGKSSLQTLLELPTGTLTQRTLIYAVRTHGESPKSTLGIFDPLLSFESTKHSTHQASINLQGHHNWGQRFQLISARLPDRLLAQEVCAESWPGQNLVAAAEECVHSWRQSSGHWSAVSAGHPRYGYDMKRGTNGVWYATGIFGKR